MYNDLFSIGPVMLHGYGLAIAIGILAAFALATKRAKRKGLDPGFVLDLGLGAVIFGFIGAKLLFCIVEWDSFVRDPLSILSGGGFVVYGGILLGIFGDILLCKFKKKPFLPYFDLMMPSIALAQAFGRIGCFLAGCCYGQETDCALGIVFSHSAFAPNGIRLIPTQLISSAGDFLICGLLLLYARRRRAPGKVAGLYLLLYGVGRFVIEFFRGDLRGSIGILSTSQFISIFIVIAGAILFLTRKRVEPELELPGDSAAPDTAESKSESEDAPITESEKHEQPAQDNENSEDDRKNETEK